MAEEALSALDHIGIRSPDVEQSAAFYESLGFHRAAAFSLPEDGSKVVFMQQADTMLEIYQGDPTQAATIDHIAMKVPNVDRLYAELSASGFTIEEKEVMQLPFWQSGIRYFNVVGPNAERIEFCQKL